MYCKKCGTEQKDGQKFCPKCGETFVVQNGNSRIDEYKRMVTNLVDGFKKKYCRKDSKLSASFFKEFLNNKKRMGLATKIVASLLVSLLVMVLISWLGGAKGDGSPQSSKSPQDEFLETIDKSQTAYMVRIDKNVIRTNVGARQVEVPVGEGSSQDSFEWTIIFFPTNETKTMGKAKVEPWLVDRNAWADGFKISYDYEVRDNLIEFYNGVSFSMYKAKYVSCKDMRLVIEYGNDNIQLRGEFSDKERVFKLSMYRDFMNKDKHNRK